MIENILNYGYDERRSPTSPEIARPMNRAKEDLLLHPVRLRIIQATAGRHVTAQALAAELPDVPQATLYRQLRILTEAGILAVASERRVRNMLERTYALSEKSLLLAHEDLQGATPEDHIRLFTQYLGSLLGYYARYLRHGDIDLARDEVVFRAFPVYLSPAERARLDRDVDAALRPYLENGPSPGRRRTVLGLMALPDATETAPRPDA